MATTVEEKATPAAGVAPVIEDMEPVAIIAFINQAVLSATFQGLQKGAIKKKYSGYAARIMAGVRPAKRFYKKKSFYRKRYGGNSCFSRRRRY